MAENSYIPGDREVEDWENMEYELSDPAVRDPVTLEKTTVPRDWEIEDHASLRRA